MTQREWQCAASLLLTIEHLNSGEASIRRSSDVLTIFSSGERPLTGTECLDCFLTSGETLLIGGEGAPPPKLPRVIHMQTFIVPICTP
jgi:hypothetical protein